MKRRSKILLLLVVSVWLCALENYSQNRNHERVLFNKALYRYEGGDYKASFKRFEELTKLNPNDCEYFLFAGLSLMNSSDSVSHALKWFDKGLQCDSAIGTTPETRDDLLLAKGEVLRALIRLDDAIEVYDRIIAQSKIPASLNEARLKKKQTQQYRLLVANAIPALINNIGAPINSPFDDHTACFNLRGDRIYFTSKRNGKLDGHEGHERIFYSKKGDSTWLAPEILPVFDKELGHEAMLSLSCDESLMAVFQSIGGCQDVYAMSNQHGTWQHPVRFADPIGSQWNQTHVSFSSDLSTVFFTSDRPGGFGGLDIYMAKKLENNRWGEIRNLGPTINTSGDEETPFMHANGHTFYFASEGHNGMGRFDNFYAEMLSDSTFSEAGNMGYPINSMEDDFAFFPDIANRLSLLSSTRMEQSVGGCDLYLVELDSSYSSKVAVIKMIADDSLGTVTRVLIKRQVDSLLVGDYRPLTTNGEYTACLETSYGYSLVNHTDTSEYCARTIYLPDSLAYEVSKEVFTLNDVPFFAEMIVEPPAIEETAPAENPRLKPFTIQVVALKRRPLFVNSYLRHLNRDAVRQFRCSDGYVRYLYGDFETRKEAVSELLKIRKSGRYADAFVRTNQSVAIMVTP